MDVLFYPVSLYNVPHLLFFPIPDRTKPINVSNKALPISKVCTIRFKYIILARAADSSPLSPDKTNVRMSRKRF